MKGVVYSTAVDSQAAGTENRKIILEVWFEKLGICINQNQNIFRHGGPRKAINHFGTLEFPDHFCSMIKEFVELREKLEPVNTQMFSALRQRLSDHKGKHFTVDR